MRIRVNSNYSSKWVVDCVYFKYGTSTGVHFHWEQTKVVAVRNLRYRYIEKRVAEHAGYCIELDYDQIWIIIW
jgi:hypothetical protein